MSVRVCMCAFNNKQMMPFSYPRCFPKKTNTCPSFHLFLPHFLFPILVVLRARESPDGPLNKWSQCQFCNVVITTVNLWRHIRTQHTPQPPRQCDHCSKQFKNKYSLREHVRIAHESKAMVGDAQQGGHQQQHHSNAAPASAMATTTTTVATSLVPVAGSASTKAATTTTTTTGPPPLTSLTTSTTNVVITDGGGGGGNIGGGASSVEIVQKMPSMF